MMLKKLIMLKQLITFVLVCLGATESSQWRFISEPADVLVARGQPVRFDCVLQGPPATRSSSSSSDSPTDVRWIKDGAFLTLEGDTRR